MKEGLLLTMAPKLPVLPPPGPKDGDQTFRPDRWPVETMSPSCVQYKGGPD